MTIQVSTFRSRSAWHHSKLPLFTLTSHPFVVLWLESLCHMHLRCSRSLWCGRFMADIFRITFNAGIPLSQNSVSFEQTHNLPTGQSGQTLNKLSICLPGKTSSAPSVSSFLDMSLRCSQSFPKINWKWFTVGGISRTFWMCHSGTFWGHCSGSFWVLLTGNTVIALLGTLQRKFWMSHLGKFWVLSLGKLWIFPQCSWWEHPGHMTWNTANILTISWPRDWEHSEWTWDVPGGFLPLYQKPLKKNKYNMGFLPPRSLIEWLSSSSIFTLQIC